MSVKNAALRQSRLDRESLDIRGGRVQDFVQVKQR